MININDVDSPFYAGIPVSPDNFIGREEVLENILKRIASINTNKQQHFFITGERGIGKTSLTNYIADIVEKEFEYFTIHIENNGVDSTEELLQNIIAKILEEAKKESISTRFKELIKDNVESVGAWKTQIKLSKQSSLLGDIKHTFIYTVQDLLGDIHNKKGILIIIDDINGLSDNEEFPNWYKSMVDTIAVSSDLNLKIACILTGYTEKFAKLHKLNPSFSRIFYREDLDILKDEEVQKFYTKSFKKIGVTINEDALDLMIKYANGLPLIMQEIGLSLFYKLKISKCITLEKTIDALSDVRENIGKQLIYPYFEESEKRREYKSLLLKISQYKEFKFKKDDLEKIIFANEEKVLDDFLKLCIDLSMLKLENDEYIISNNILKTYFKLLEFENFHKMIV